MATAGWQRELVRCVLEPEVLGPFGISLAVMGGVLRVLSRTRYWRISINARKVLAKDYELWGDQVKAARLSHEARVLEARFPIYARLCVVVGLSLVILSLAAGILRRSATAF